MARKRPRQKPKAPVEIKQASVYSDTYLAAMYPLTEAQISKVPTEMRCPACQHLIWAGGAPTMAEMPIRCGCTRAFTVSDVMKLVGVA